MATSSSVLTVTRARLERRAIPAVGLPTTAHGVIAARDALQLELFDETGRCGRGEAAPLPGFSRDSIEQCAAALGGLDTRLPVVDLARPTLPQIAAAVALLDPGCPAARFALESALLDLTACRLDLPVHALLAGAPVEAPVALCALLAADREAEVVAAARAAVARGLSTVKWKIGRPGRFEEELSILTALRRALGDRVALRADANRGIADAQVAAALARLAPLALELVEEPARSGMDGVPRAAVPVAADESIAQGGWPPVERALREGRCAAVVLKPTLLGGLQAALEIGRRAHALGAGVIVTHTFEGPIAMAGAAALALALPARRLACGLDRHPALDESALRVTAIGAHSIAPGGWIGLGLEVA